MCAKQVVLNWSFFVPGFVTWVWSIFRFKDLGCWAQIGCWRVVSNRGSCNKQIGVGFIFLLRNFDRCLRWQTFMADAYNSYWLLHSTWLILWSRLHFKPIKAFEIGSYQTNSAFDVFQHAAWNFFMTQLLLTKTTHKCFWSAWDTRPRILCNVRLQEKHVVLSLLCISYHRWLMKTLAAMNKCKKKNQL